MAIRHSLILVVYLYWCCFGCNVYCQFNDDIQGLIKEAMSSQRASSNGNGFDGAAMAGINDNNLIKDNGLDMVGRASSSYSPSKDGSHMSKMMASLSTAGIGRNFRSRDDSDKSIKSLLNSFQVDDQNGNVFHHVGQSGRDAMQEILRHGDEEQARTREGDVMGGPSTFGMGGGAGGNAQGGDDYLVTKYVTMRICSVGNEFPCGEILIGLFGNTVPKTVANFVSLADHERGFGFRGSKFHRIIKDFMIQGGDITNGDGTGGRSIYGAHFDDENFRIQMNGAGWACMANAGPNTNDSQFFITTADTPWLNGKHVCFGKLLKGWDTVNQAQQVQKDSNDRPLRDVIIEDSKSAPVDQPFVASREPVA